MLAHLFADDASGEHVSNDMWGTAALGVFVLAMFDKVVDVVDQGGDGMFDVHQATHCLRVLLAGPSKLQILQSG